MVGWKSNANFFPCQEKKNMAGFEQSLLFCGTGKKEDIPARLTQLTAGGLDVGQDKDAGEQIVVSLDAAVEYVASIMMKQSTKGGRHPGKYGGTDLAKKKGERWKEYTRCDGGFWEKLGKNDYDDEGVVSWGVTDEVVFTNTAVPGGDQVIVVDAPDDELMYGDDLRDDGEKDEMLSGEEFGQHGQPS